MDQGLAVRCRRPVRHRRRIGEYDSFFGLANDREHSEAWRCARWVAGCAATQNAVGRECGSVGVASVGRDDINWSIDLGHRDPKHTVHYSRVAAGRSEGLWR